MITPDQSLWLSLLAVALAAVALLAVLLLWARVRKLDTHTSRFESELTVALEQFQGLSVGAVGQSKHLVRVEHDLNRLRGRMEQLAAVTEGGGASFNQAIRMARKGCSAKEIMETCGLSQIEADLVVLLHKEEKG